MLIQATLVKPMELAFLYMPGLIQFTKMVPHEIEATMMGFVISLVNFATQVLARFWAVLLNLIFQVQIEQF